MENKKLNKMFPLSFNRVGTDFIKVDTLIKKKAVLALALTLPKPLIIFCDTQFETCDLAKEIDFFVWEQSLAATVIAHAASGYDKERLQVGFLTEDLTDDEKIAVKERFLSGENAILCAQYDIVSDYTAENIRTKLYLISPDRESSRGMILIETEGISPCLDILQRGVEIEAALSIVQKHPKRFTERELSRQVQTVLNETFRLFFAENIFDSRDTTSLIKCLISRGTLRVLKWPFTGLIEAGTIERDLHLEPDSPAC